MTAARAMILAAGRGKRLRPLTDQIPKPLVPVAGRTLLDRALDQLQRHGLAEVVVNVCYKAELIMAHVSNRRQPAVHVIREERALETGGGITNALPLLGEDAFFVLNSDTICLDSTDQPPALARLQATWQPESMDGLLLLHPVDRAVGYDGQGDFVIEQGRMRRRRAGELAPYVFTGIQLLHPRLFAACPDGPFSMNVLYDRLLAEEGYFNRLGYLIHAGDWLHVGDPQGLAQAEAILNTGEEEA